MSELKTYQALYTIRAEVSVKVNAKNPKEATDYFDSFKENGIEYLLDIGTQTQVEVEWDSTRRPIKIPPAKRSDV